MIMIISFILAVLCILSPGVTALPNHHHRVHTPTNAHQLARGLPLLPPRAPTRVRRHAPSTSPMARRSAFMPTRMTTTSYLGRLALGTQSLTGVMSPIGYLSSLPSASTGAYGVTTRPDDALLVSISGIDSTSNSVLVETLNGYLANIATRLTADFAPGSSDLGIIGQVGITEASSDNSYFNATGEHAPAAIHSWAFDPAYKKLTPSWVGENDTYGLDVLYSQSDFRVLLSPRGRALAPHTSKIVLFLIASTQ